MAAPETKAATERARLLIEQAEKLGEAPEDPLLLFSVLYGFWAVDQVAFKGDAALELAAQFLTLAEKQGTTDPVLIGHRLVGVTSVFAGRIAQAQTHLDKAVSLYDPVQHRPLATRFSHDPGVAALCYRAIARWLLGHADAAIADSNKSRNDARRFGQAGTLLFALFHTSLVDVLSGNYTEAGTVADEVIDLADEKATAIWKGFGMMELGATLVPSGKAKDAVQMINAGIETYRSTGATVFLPFYLPLLGTAYAQLGQFDDAWRCIHEAMTAVKMTKETWCEAEVHRLAGEIALKSPDSDATKTETYYRSALDIAQQQQAKSWELRAAMSLARLWRSQGKPHRGRELLAPVYGWFTEGFDTRDLKEAKALLADLAA